MGQGWSQEYTSSDLYNNTGSTTSNGLGPRVRADSEPPTSAHYGGTKLNANIPEDEELTTTPTNLAQISTPIAVADWKRASGDSGILKEKPAQLAALLDSKASTSSTFSDFNSSENRELLNPPKPRDRSQSVGGYSHFSDFSLFPDKFGANPIKRRHPSNGSSITEEVPSIPCTPPSTPNITTPLQSIKESFFRTRALSYDPERDAAKEDIISKSPSIGNGDINGSKIENDNQLSIRPRSSSYGGGKRNQRHKGVHAERTPFADYTLFPDKDPKCATNTSELKSEKVMRNDEVSRKKTPPSKLSTVSGQPPTVIITPDNIDYINSAVLIASALTAEANKQSRYDDKQRIAMEERNNNNNVKKSAQPRFNFFDYSMIPDKDPRAFVPNKQRKQHEEMFGKDQN